MGTRDKRVDAYVAKSAGFAKPILETPALSLSNVPSVSIVTSSRGGRQPPPICSAGLQPRTRPRGYRLCS